MHKFIVTNGSQTDIIVTEDEKLWIYNRDTRTTVDLGQATKDRLDDIIENLQRLRRLVP